MTWVIGKMRRQVGDVILHGPTGRLGKIIEVVPEISEYNVVFGGDQTQVVHEIEIEDRQIPYRPGDLMYVWANGQERSGHLIHLLDNTALVEHYCDDEGHTALRLYVYQPRKGESYRWERVSFVPFGYDEFPSEDIRQLWEYGMESVLRLNPAGWSGLALARLREEFEIRFASYVAERGEQGELIETWVDLGRKNHFIGGRSLETTDLSQADRPAFTRYDIHVCQSQQELFEKLATDNWAVGVGYAFRHVCFINQVNGGGEWLTLVRREAVDSISWASVIRDGRHEALLERLLLQGTE